MSVSRGMSFTSTFRMRDKQAELSGSRQPVSKLPTPPPTSWTGPSVNRHLLCRMPAQSWTPTMPKMKKMKVKNTTTLIKAGMDFNNAVTNSLIPADVHHIRQQRSGYAYSADKWPTFDNAGSPQYECCVPGKIVNDLSGRKTRIVRKAEIFGILGMFARSLFVDRTVKSASNGRRRKHTLPRRQ